MCRGDGGGERGRDRTQGGGITRKSGGESSRVEAARRGLATVDDAEVEEVVEHLPLRRSQRGQGVVLAEGERAEHEKKREDLDAVHVEGFRVREVEDHEAPDLRVDFLEEEGEALLCDGDARPVGRSAVFDQSADLEKLGDALGGCMRYAAKRIRMIDRADHVVQDRLPLGTCKGVEVRDVDSVLVGGVAGDTEGLMSTAAG